MTRYPFRNATGSRSLFSRRQFLQHIAGVSGGAVVLSASGLISACGPLGESNSLSNGGKPSSLTVAASGGSFLENQTKYGYDPFSEEHGIDIEAAPGSTGPTGAEALRANRTQAPYDSFSAGIPDLKRLGGEGLLKELTEENVPNLANIDPKFLIFDGYAVPFDYSSVGIIYNTEEISDPPTSWREFIDRTSEGEFGKNVFFPNVPSLAWTMETLMRIADVESGDPSNLDAALDAINRMKPNIVKFFTTYSEPVDLIQRREATIGLGWDGRAWIAHDETDGQISWIAPDEGAITALSSMAVPMHTSSPEWALQLLNHMISVEVQGPFCEAMFYGSANTQVQYSDTLATRIPAVDDVHLFDYDIIAQNQADWFNRWNTEIAV